MEDTSERTGEIADLKGRLRALEARLESVEKLLGLGPRGTPVRFDPGLADFASTADTGRVAPPDDTEAQGDELGSSAPAAAPDVTALPEFELKAYRLVRGGWGEGWELRPAPPRRKWMDEHPHAYHCLPLVIANQWGWQVLCPCDARVVWAGGADPASLTVELAEAPHVHSIKSQFGQGIVTFSPPWLFRTPPGWDLMVKGPMNRWKANCAPLEGIIETWWLPYTFTMNWKLQEPGEVTFRKGESLCQLLPVPHATFRSARAVELPIESEPELAAELARWRDERRGRAGSRQQNHLMYRKAANVEGHLVRVPVPPIGPSGS
jgi:hypothetical protein